MAIDQPRDRDYEIAIEDGAIRAMDLRQIRVGDDDYGLKTYDPAFKNTASCKSRITYIDGEKGILRYRGYPIEQLAEQSSYIEVAYLILNGELPTASQLDAFDHEITHHSIIPEYIICTSGFLMPGHRKAKESRYDFPRVKGPLPLPSRTSNSTFGNAALSMDSTSSTKFLAP